ncbi:hypothetical protein [Mycobacterium celatum]|uniref:Uncharacterized protein n=1 Tax=Mycobacterium celatum TaxID=28045 RepID=A0A1X1RPG7_MYCCE|nr:hypothetical protein [Mycobacterium celatum]ORV10927.1 hypothetical protein AWB95_14010 [Mycobacterium celatum]PIB79534.1 hypothetical protein CQY23_08155 [Mycobacterium celatum]
MRPTGQVVLRPRVDVALSRATTRGGDELSLPEPISQLRAQFSDRGELERHVVDSSDQTVEETVAWVRDGLERDAYLLPR